MAPSVVPAAPIAPIGVGMPRVIAIIFPKNSLTHAVLLLPIALLFVWAKMNTRTFIPKIDVQRRQWRVVDAQNKEVVITLYETKLGGTFDKDLFRYDTRRGGGERD